MSAWLDLNHHPRNPFPWIPNSDLSSPPKGVLFPEYYDVLLSWKTPVLVMMAYTVVVKWCNSRITSEKTSRVVAESKGEVKIKQTTSSPLFVACIFLHNLALAVYSGWTFYHTFTVYRRNLKTMDFWTVWCDKSGDFWTSTLGLYGYYFYLSKYYEIVDTIIILLKGRKSSTLQTYHHAGAIFTMWANINYAAHPIWVFVILNSFVHTIMYTYYAATTLGLNPPYKQYITRLQLTQFFVGQCIGASYFLVSNGPTRGGECFTRAGPRFAIGSVMLYVAPLIWLFVEFARRIYGKRKQA